MKNIPKTLKYTRTHEWLRLEGDNTAYVGITDHAQALLGDIVFVELPALEKKIKKGEEICVLESVKAAADVYSPLSGDIIETNPALRESPELINSDSYGEGWLFRIKFSDVKELENLLTAESYQQQLSVETH
ncbi:MAG: glycine cleavage system protein GcvH [Pseudomonadota bacterium]